MVYSFRCNHSDLCIVAVAFAADVPSTVISSSLATGEGGGYQCGSLDRHILVLASHGPGIQNSVQGV